ncbi:MAG: hypothetical protein RKE49_07795 [Oceanicaulis sp.]
MTNRTESKAEAEARFFIDAHLGHVTEQLGQGAADDLPYLLAHVDNRARAPIEATGKTRRPVCQCVYAGRVRFSDVGNRHVLGFKVETPGLDAKSARAHLGVARVFLREHAARGEVCETPLIGDIEIETFGSEVWVKCTRAEARRLGALDVSYFLIVFGAVSYGAHEGGKAKSKDDLSIFEKWSLTPRGIWRRIRDRAWPTVMTFATALTALGFVHVAPTLWRWTVNAAQVLRDQLLSMLG